MSELEIDKKYNQLVDALLRTKPTIETKFLGEFGLNRTKLLLKKLGNPQEKLNVIHIAGTSGKGSTCYILSSLLYTHGKKIGMSLSPHLFDIRERFQIDNKFISEEKFIKYLSIVNEKIKQIETEMGSSPVYFEILSALTFYIFHEENVDYAIIETGLGGLLDSTNVVENKNKISVISKIGLDHTHILGKSLKNIAFQKIGIVNNNSKVFSTFQKKNVLKVFNEECKKKNADLIIVQEPKTSKFISNEVSFQNRLLHLNKVPLSLNGKHQVENSRLALSVFSYISIRDSINIDKNLIIRSFSNLDFIGRFTIKQINGKTIVFDGAHNPQKIKSLVQTLKEKFPNQKFHFLFGLKNNKDFVNLIRLIKPITKSLTITKIQRELGDTLTKIHFTNYKYIPEPKIAIQSLLSSESDEVIVVTGSFFLITKMEKYLNKEQAK